MHQPDRRIPASQEETSGEGEEDSIPTEDEIDLVTAATSQRRLGFNARFQGHVAYSTKYQQREWVAQVYLAPRLETAINDIKGKECHEKSGDG
jgi:hypothetical protein